ncbi:hypothetical protein [Vibrio phage vB_VmeM-Yong XC32]|nr:hypothetical protein [Vibrio phage vB_VmeM-Yong XC31]QAX96612.1 hypothetical protein [Vibrio phage vB_VmeM-Yong XC32]QAX96930.1 hypothetical protein [Vibrio phage vB_VmeM-Yong MS31]QAX97235.1 hypothetical protein [Vibrio phage vB_VmeM-Yong MS32]
MKPLYYVSERTWPKGLLPAITRFGKKGFKWREVSPGTYALQTYDPFLAMNNSVGKFSPYYNEDMPDGVLVNRFILGTIFMVILGMVLISRSEDLAPAIALAFSYGGYIWWLYEDKELYTSPAARRLTYEWATAYREGSLKFTKHAVAICNKDFTLTYDALNDKLFTCGSPEVCYLHENNEDRLKQLLSSLHPFM